MGNEMKPIVSIVIPTHNAEATLKRAIDSIRNQSLTNWELICVDNASTDTTVDLLKGYAEADKRIKVILHTKDEGLYWSRRDGIQAATGEYLMFLDADDWLEQSACLELSQMMAEKDVDLIHFRSRVISVEQADPGMVHAVDEFIRPYSGLAKNVDLINFCYAEEHFSFSIWNKIYKTTMFKNLLPDMDHEYIITGEDLLLVFMYLWNAKTYYGDRDGKLYHNYSIGGGLSSRRWMPLNSLRTICSGGTAAKLLKLFLVKKGGTPKYSFAFDRCEERLVNDAIYTWAFRLCPEDRTEGLKILFEYWDAKTVLPKMVRDYATFGTQVGEAAKRISYFQTEHRAVKTIGVMVLRMCNGGIERVVALLISLWKNMGYQVVLLTEEQPSEDDYPFPEDTPRVILPSYASPEAFPYRSRCHTLLDAVQEYELDVIVDTQYYSVSNIWDAMTIRSAGVPVIMAVHNAFLQVAMYGKEALDIRFPGYAMANLLVTLSEMDKKTAELLGYTCCFIPNPVDPSLWKIKRADLSGKNVLYMGRLEEQKRPLDLLRIFARTLQSVPDAKLFVVGKPDTEEWAEMIKNEIIRLGIEGSVELCGYQSNPYGYLQKADVFLMPSLFEGYPMAMLESKAAGLPCVSYNMPYLEFQQYEKGMLVAEQGDVEGAARHVIDLLTDAEYRKSVGQAARESFEHFAGFSLEGLWREAFQTVTQLSPDTFTMEKDLKDGRDILETYHFFREIGWENGLSTIETELDRKGIKKVLKLHAIVSMFRHVGWKERIKIIAKLILRCFGIKRPFYCEEYEVRRKILETIDNIR